MFQVEVTKKDLLEAMHSLVAAGARTIPLAATRLPPHCAPLLQTQVQSAAVVLQNVFPLYSDTEKRQEYFKSLKTYYFIAKPII